MKTFQCIKTCPEFLPVNMDEAEQLGYKKDNIDFVIITGDAYVDHPSFGASLIGKLLYSLGYSVGLISQPDWRVNKKSVKNDFGVFGVPRLAFLVTSGNVDSMVNHYTVAKKKRSNDYYSPGNNSGFRPDRAVTVYSRKIREIFGNEPLIILGGLEASLRRLAHYDYWSDTVKKSVLIDSMADIIVYGMGERAITDIANALNRGISKDRLTAINGIVYKTEIKPDNTIFLPDFDTISNNKESYANSFRLQYENTDYLTSKALCEPYDNCFVVQTPPQRPLSTEELDYVYGLRFAGKAHKMYEQLGGVPAIEEVKFSITSSRGCFGGCSFCALSFHQGRSVTSRSHESIIEEAKKLVALPDFKGYIHDVGGPTANFRKASCLKQEKSGICKNRRCLSPSPCPNLIVDHSDYLSLLRKLRSIKGIKKVFVRSGIRYDYLIYDKNTEFFEELCEHHVSGQLKVAPEHISKSVLSIMGKPSRNVYDTFVSKYKQINEKLGKKQFLVPYLMSSHPGSGLREAIELAEYLRDNRISPEQVQDFYPTPATVSTCIYYTGINPLTNKRVYVAKTPHEKAMQRSLIQYRLPQNEKLVREALKLAGRDDLIGFEKKSLIRPRPNERYLTNTNKNKQKNEVKSKIKKKKTIRNVHKKKT